MAYQAPDSWEDDLAEDTRQMNMGGQGQQGGRGGGRGGYGGGRGGGGYHNYNPNAQSFVPNAQAQAFVPGQSYGGVWMSVWVGVGGLV